MRLLEGFTLTCSPVLKMYRRFCTVKRQLVQDESIHQPQCRKRRSLAGWLARRKNASHPPRRINAVVLFTRWWLAPRCREFCLCVDVFGLRPLEAIDRGIYVRLKYIFHIGMCVSFQSSGLHSRHPGKETTSPNRRLTKCVNTQ